MTGTRQREMAAWQEASGTEPEELTYKTVPAPSAERLGRVTDAAAHMPGILSMKLEAANSVGSARSRIPPGEAVSRR